MIDHIHNILNRINSDYFLLMNFKLSDFIKQMCFIFFPLFSLQFMDIPFLWTDTHVEYLAQLLEIKNMMIFGVNLEDYWG